MPKQRRKKVLVGWVQKGWYLKTDDYTKDIIHSYIYGHSWKDITNTEVKVRITIEQLPNHPLKEEVKKCLERRRSEDKEKQSNRPI
jgi:hypothetical protein